MNQPTLTSSFAVITSCFLIWFSNADAHPFHDEEDCINQKIRASSSHFSCLIQAETDSWRSKIRARLKARCERTFKKHFKEIEKQATRMGLSCLSHGKGPGILLQSIKSLSAQLVATNTVKTVQVNIDDEDYLTQFSQGKQLNFANRVNGEYNVIWLSARQYYSRNTFQWSPTFFALLTNSPPVPVSIVQSMQQVSINPGQTVTVTNSNFGPPTDGGSANAITVSSVSSQTFYTGLSRQLSFSGVGTITSPIYVSTFPLLTYLSVAMIPTDEVMVWFGDPQTSTGQFFDFPPSNFITVNLANSTNRTLIFSDGKWYEQ